MKKLVALLLVAALGLSTLAGCGGNGNSSGSGSASSGATSESSQAENSETGDDAAPAETQKVVFAMQTFNTVPTVETAQTVADEVNSYIKENYPDANVELEWQLYGPADYEQRINLMMQSGEQLDLFIPSNIATSISSNQLAPVTSALESEYGQKLVDIITEYCGEEVWKTVTMNGEIMAVPANKNMALAGCLTYDYDMLTSVGFDDDDITDLASLEPIFAALKEKYPDVYCYVGTDVGNANLPYVFYADNSIDSIGNDYGVVFGDSNEVVNVFESDAWYELCQMMKRWYDGGYMPGDMATSTMRGAEYMNAGRAFCTFASYGVREDYTDFGEMQTRSTGRTIHAKKISPPYVTTDFASAVLGVPSTSKSVDGAIKLLSIAYTDEYVYNTMLYGLEDRDYVWMDEELGLIGFPEGMDANTVPYCAYMTMGEWGTEAYMWSQYDVSTPQTAEELEYNADYALRVNKESPKSPYYGFRFDGEQYLNQITAMDNLYNQYAVPLMCGSVDIDSTLEAFNQALYDAGLQQVMDAKQEQLDAWLAEQG